MPGFLPRAWIPRAPLDSPAAKNVCRTCMADAAFRTRCFCTHADFATLKCSGERIFRSFQAFSEIRFRRAILTDDISLPVFALERGTLPMLVSIPHLGREIPSEISASMSAVAANNDDCDWHLDRLYAFVKELGASVITPTCSRYVIDLNRPPDGQNLYPGQKTTGLVPVDTFDEKPLYPDGRARPKRRSPGDARNIGSLITRR